MWKPANKVIHYKGNIPNFYPEKFCFEGLIFLALNATYQR
jgi:hypothetical protein